MLLLAPLLAGSAVGCSDSAPTARRAVSARLDERFSSSAASQRAPRRVLRRKPVHRGVTAEGAVLLAAAARSADFRSRLIVAELLGCVSWPGALSTLERFLGDPEEDVRAASLRALAQRSERTRASAALLSVQRDTEESPLLRAMAAAYLASPSPRCPKE